MWSDKIFSTFYDDYLERVMVRVIDPEAFFKIKDHKFGLPEGQEDMDEEGAGAIYASLAFDH